MPVCKLDAGKGCGMRTHPAVMMLVVSSLALSLGGCSHNFNGGSSDTLVTNVILGPGSVTLNVGETQQFSATGENGSGAELRAGIRGAPAHALI